jgi:hypothetical protein
MSPESLQLRAHYRPDSVRGHWARALVWGLIAVAAAITFVFLAYYVLPMAERICIGGVCPPIHWGIRPP